LAEALDIGEALVPVHAGVLSALGMLVAPAGRTLTRSRLSLFAALSDGEVESDLARLAGEGIAELEEEGWGREGLRVENGLDLRYRGQANALSLSWRGLAATTEAFHRRHAEAYGHRLDLPVELVNLRVRVRGSVRDLGLPPTPPSSGAGNRVPRRWLSAWGHAKPVPVYTCGSLRDTLEIRGPALVTDPVSTVWVAPGWRARPDAGGNLWLRRSAAGPGAARGLAV
jgi:N-methylhydantoinase A